MWPNQQCQSTEGGWSVIRSSLNPTTPTPPCYNNTTCMQWNTREHKNTYASKHSEVNLGQIHISAKVKVMGACVCLRVVKGSLRHIKLLSASMKQCGKMDLLYCSIKCFMLWRKHCGVLLQVGVANGKMANAADARQIGKNLISLLFCYFNGKLKWNITDHDIKRYAQSAVKPKFGLQQ